MEENTKADGIVKILATAKSKEAALLTETEEKRVATNPGDGTVKTEIHANRATADTVGKKTFSIK